MIKIVMVMMNMLTKFVTLKKKMLLVVVTMFAMMTKIMSWTMMIMMTMTRIVTIISKKQIASFFVSKRNRAVSHSCANDY